MNAPLPFQWQGDSFTPLPRFAAACDQQFTIGEVYRLVAVEERSMNSHRHFFAALHDAWLNLPEAVGDRFPTSEHLRKYCLIRSGFRDERSFVCASKDEAQRLASFVKPIDDYAFVVVSEATVTVYTAKSQSLKAMGKADFQRSKQAVLDICAEFIDVAPEALSSNAGKAA